MIVGLLYINEEAKMKRLQTTVLSSVEDPDPGGKKTQ
jgi:hypothetical protein